MYLSCGGGKQEEHRIQFADRIYLGCGGGEPEEHKIHCADPMYLNGGGAQDTLCGPNVS